MQMQRFGIQLGESLLLSTGHVLTIPPIVWQTTPLLKPAVPEVAE